MNELYIKKFFMFLHKMLVHNLGLIRLEMKILRVNFAWFTPVGSFENFKPLAFKNLQG